MSSSESDVNLRLLSESVDSSIFSDDLYGKAENPKNEMSQEKCEQQTELKSQRYLDFEDEKSLKSDLVVPDSMQKFIYNKLSKILDNQVEYVVEKKSKKRKKNEQEDEESIDNVRLLSDSEVPVKFYDPPELPPGNRKKVAIKRRTTEPETDEAEKIQSAAIDGKLIATEVKSWSNKVKSPTTDYKIIKGVGYIRDVPNEFTKARNKNSWSENKIKNAKYFNKSLESSIES